MEEHAYYPMKIDVLMVDVSRVRGETNYPVSIYYVVDDLYNLAFLEAPS
jgi:hypothetical protein